MEKENQGIRGGKAKTSSQRVNAEEILRSIGILRKVTKAVKVAPFLYIIAYMLTMPFYMFCDGIIVDALDMTLYMSPVAVLLLVVLSYSLKFCLWHRFQCVLPTLSQIVVLIDTYIYQLSESASTLLLSISLTLTFLSLLNTYFVFIKKPDLHRQG